MTDCKQSTFEFQGLGRKHVTVNFNGGYLSSDGGGLFLRQVESRHRIIANLSKCFVDYRNPLLIEHPVSSLLAQRIHGLALGYEAVNDHDRLRLDPVHALLAGKKDVLGSNRMHQADKGKALAAHATLHRLDKSAHCIDARYCKIQAQADKIEALLIDEAVKALPRNSRGGCKINCVN